MKRKLLAIILLIILLATSLLACSAENKQPGYNKGDSSGNNDEQVREEENANGAPINSSDIDSDRKIIKTVTLKLETKKFDDAIEMLEQFVADNNGYIESSDIGGTSYYQYNPNTRTATYVIRIPADALDNYVGAVSANFNVTDKKENAQDISDTYYDTEARLKTYQIEEERFLEMMKDASSLDYIIQLEDKLATIRYNIESLTAKIRRYDNLVSYSTVKIELREVLDYTSEPPKTFGDRMETAFVEGWQSFAVAMGDLLVGITYALPVLLILAIIIVIAITVVYTTNKHRRRKLEMIYTKSKSDAGENK
ncbi:MAG: DUF4349 domain-containing protein [Clostridiales bacterium]|nr:DUF4349 domain-containing protein [Clostridiales bacterium]